MNKVNIEITETGWKTTIIYKGKEYSETYVFDEKEDFARCTDGNLDNEQDIPYKLIDTVVKGTMEFNVMKVLQKFK